MKENKRRSKWLAQCIEAKAQCNGLHIRPIVQQYRLRVKVITALINNKCICFCSVRFTYNSNKLWNPIKVLSGIDCNLLKDKSLKNSITQHRKTVMKFGMFINMIKAIYDKTYYRIHNALHIMQFKLNSLLSDA